MTSAPLVLLSLMVINDYAPPRTWELLGVSDLIITGTIEHVEEKTFTVHISQIVAGNYSKEYIMITKFEDWTCGNRGYDYRMGQSAIFCLTVRKIVGFFHFSEEFFVRGGGNEGEIPISGDYAYYQNNYCGEQEGPSGIPYEKYDLNGVSFFAQRIPVQVLIDTIQGFRRCYHIDVNEDLPWFEKERFAIQTICTVAELENFQNASSFNRYLVDSMRKDLDKLE